MSLQEGLFPKVVPVVQLLSQVPPKSAQEQGWTRLGVWLWPDEPAINGSSAPRWVSWLLQWAAAQTLTQAQGRAGHPHPLQSALISPGMWVRMQPRFSTLQQKQPRDSWEAQKKKILSACYWLSSGECRQQKCQKCFGLLIFNTCSRKSGSSLGVCCKSTTRADQIPALVAQPYHLWKHWSLPCLPTPKTVLAWKLQAWLHWRTAWAPITALLIALQFLKAFSQKWNSTTTCQPGLLRYTKAWPPKEKGTKVTPKVTVWCSMSVLHTVLH